jgi:hypothetical protein
MSSGRGALRRLLGSRPSCGSVSPLVCIASGVSGECGRFVMKNFKWRSELYVSEGGEAAQGVKSRDSSPFTRPIGRAFRLSVYICTSWLGFPTVPFITPVQIAPGLLSVANRTRVFVPRAYRSRTSQGYINQPFRTTMRWRAENVSTCCLQTIHTLSRTSTCSRLCQGRINHVVCHSM